MTFTSLAFLGSLVRWLGLAALISLITHVAWLRWKSELAKSKLSIRLWQLKTSLQQKLPFSIGRTLRTTANLIALLTAFMVGSLWRDMQLADHTDSYANVMILDKYAGGQDFRMSIDGGQPFHATICPTYIPYDFVKGATIKLMKFEQRGNCKSFAGPSLGYTMLEKNGKLILANLEESNAR
jgi:hypothetical protein